MRTFFYYSLFFFSLGLLSAPAFAQPKGMKPVGGNAPAGTERRLALVIGNKDYQKMNPLRNPLNDGNDMAVALEQLGFVVIQTTNADYRTFLNSINLFKDRLSDSDVALFYYSGHGLSYGGKNYLMPTDADISCLDHIEEYGISLNRILSDISAKGVKNSFVLLDACRNVPNLKVCDNTKRDINVNNSLVKPTNNPRGSMIVYATEEGSTADDNVKERNGLFTAALLKYLIQPNWGIRTILDQTTIEVEKRSSGAQSPGRYDKLQGDFVFVQTASQPSKGEPSAPPVRTEPAKPAVDLEPITMVSIPGGSFMMGSNEGEAIEKPIHRVTVSNFRMAKYETTVAEFEQFVEDTGYQTQAEKEKGSTVFVNGKWEKKSGVSWRCNTAGEIRPRSEYNHPVIHVSWNDAVEYCKWLSLKTSQTYRLPTEAEWEYAARGGQQSKGYTYAGSNDMNEVGWFGENTQLSGTRAVGQKAQNELGLYDMSGNVLEWCSDWYSTNYYINSSTNNPKGGPPGSNHVLRGGNWFLIANSRVASRLSSIPSYCNSYIGFRVVVSQ
ncbi:SUMF1/EgtB/PvdO family nonheme iron enzyme [Runella sp. MFBS21]|uniref:SUMF1/EgtB/PvdO family nonheme iron enzyme n=1 Tax=Runella sp. MFBS21 TaxID=3034018 RepID=UPI0023F8700E|nr:SUMF1/EgtB/PvdO family nonheme iron enzyme [Runella sp. MFBS21]MDF7821831.1 SUMF1/EgtB/PvdO family nonheme iron enzyme [Runella sp. MFBS21]